MIPSVSKTVIKTVSQVASTAAAPVASATTHKVTSTVPDMIAAASKVASTAPKIDPSREFRAKIGANLYGAFVFGSILTGMAYDAGLFHLNPSHHDPSKEPK